MQGRRLASDFVPALRVQVMGVRGMMLRVIMQEWDAVRCTIRMCRIGMGSFEVVIFCRE
jgi:hypothetical protein